jgi:putative endonuclease
VDTTRLGRLGEEQAARFLEARGWTILERNVRSGRKEVDLIVRRGKVLAFVEVKCRRGVGFGDPLEAITAAKRREIARVARDWLGGRDLPPLTEIRFDAVSVYWPRGGKPRIQHVPDAFRLG